MNCLKCSKELTQVQIKEKGKFCSRSCSISFNNKNKKGKKYNMFSLGIENIIKSNILKEINQ